MNSAPSLEFAAGQLWRCVGRTTDEQPTVLINRVDVHPLGGEIFHVTLGDIHLRNPRLLSGLTTSLPHVPVIRQTLELSGAQFVGLQDPDLVYLEGYAQWKREFDAGNAGSFGVSIAKVLDFVERGLNGRG
ncbi:MAG TPA: hypothetical protein VGQ93_00340 [Lysobacter sp.]|jgi:hypothetical protein|nr:hypothetical protein [Lysobacter sp.]